MVHSNVEKCGTTLRMEFGSCITRHLKRSSSKMTNLYLWMLVAKVFIHLGNAHVQINKRSGFLCRCYVQTASAYSLKSVLFILKAKQIQDLKANFYTEVSQRNHSDLHYMSITSLHQPELSVTFCIQILEGT